MIAPLNVPAMILLQRVEDDVCSLSTVEDVAKDMQLVDGEALYYVTESYDKVVGSSCGDDGIDDYLDVCRFVHVVATFVQ